VDRKVYVCLDLNGKVIQVGQLYARSLRGKESASFQYDRSWLSHPERFALEPALELFDGAYHTGIDRDLFGSIGDSAPDRWGSILMRRAAAREARDANKQPGTLTEIDYLLGVYDEARQGALRFSEREGGPFLHASNSSPIPPLIELPKLLSASENLLEDKESDEDLRLLLAPGSSLGGARPKASIRDRDSGLAIAKFPRKDDEFSTVLWESLALKLAAKAGLPVPEWRVEFIINKPTLILYPNTFKIWIYGFEKTPGSNDQNLPHIAILG
jgi:serine/threonine-protein kinase HipA